MKTTLFKSGTIVGGHVRRFTRGDPKRVGAG